MSAAEQMAAALITLTDAGGRPPCGDRSGAWTSEDRAQRQEAALRCQPCPLLTICEQYAREIHASFGVFGGTDFTPRPLRGRTW
jgi:hypothetical protein